MAGRRGAASWVWANIRRQYREEKERYDSYADRSGDRGLALCGCAGAVRLRRHAHRQCPILRPPHARRRAGGGAVHGGLRVLDLLPAPLAAADRAHAAEGCNDDGVTALTPPKAAMTTAPAPTAPAAPTRPRNPVTDITPPAAPASPPPSAPPAHHPPPRHACRRAPPPPPPPAPPTGPAHPGAEYPAPRRSGFAAAVRRAGKSAPRALGLRRTVLLMFSHVWVVSKLSGEVVELHEEGLS